MRGHSCGERDLFTRLFPEDVDEGRDLHGPALILLYSFVRAVACRFSRRGVAE